MYRPAHYGQVDLGVAYANGKGVARDHIRAYKWLSLAASQGDEHALVIRNWVATRMTPGQIAGLSGWRANGPRCQTKKRQRPRLKEVLSGKRRSRFLAVLSALQSKRRAFSH